MRTLQKGLTAFNDAIAKVITALGIAIIAFSVLALTGGAVTRYFTGLGFDWIMDLPPVMMPWMVFLMVGVLLRSRSHITVDFVPRYLSARGKIWLSLFVHLFVLGCAVIFFLAGVDAVQLFHALGQFIELEFDLPYWYVYLSFPVGFGILAIFAIELALKDWLALRARSGTDPIVEQRQ